MIHHVKNALSGDELAEIHSILARATWERGRESAGAQAVALKNNEQISHQSDEMRAIRSIVLKALDRHAEFFSITLPRRVFPPRVNRYSGETNAFGAHVDNAIRFTPDTGVRMRTDLSCTLFLNDPESYDGGELEFREGYGLQAVKLAAGDAIIYPGTTVHEVKPVTRGARIACFFWIESMIREEDRRNLLLDLDRTIVSLRNTHGDNPQTVALTGTYHNLLRMWADA
jgi:PKHD-type hydroxylase